MIAKARYVGCILCGLRFVEDRDPPSVGCESCGSTLVALERDLSSEVAAMLRQHGQRCGTQAAAHLFAES